MLTDSVRADKVATLEGVLIGVQARYALNVVFWCFFQFTQILARDLGPARGACSAILVFVFHDGIVVFGLWGHRDSQRLVDIVAVGLIGIDAL